MSASHTHRGFVAVPAVSDDIFGKGEANAGPSSAYSFGDLAFPDTELIKKTREFVKVRDTHWGYFD